MSTTGLPPRTVTVSLIAPTFIGTSTRATKPTLIRSSSLTTVAKPSRAHSTE